MYFYSITTNLEVIEYIKNNTLDIRYWIKWKNNLNESYNIISSRTPTLVGKKISWGKLIAKFINKISIKAKFKIEKEKY